MITSQPMMTMYVGDLEPGLELTCMDNRTPVNLTGATAVRVIGAINGVVIFDRAATSFAGTAGVVTMAWQAGDTDTVGLMNIEAEVMWPSSRPQTFRAVRGVQILEDLGGSA